MCFTNCLGLFCGLKLFTAFHHFICTSVWSLRFVCFPSCQPSFLASELITMRDTQLIKLGVWKHAPNQARFTLLLLLLQEYNSLQFSRWLRLLQTSWICNVICDLRKLKMQGVCQTVYDIVVRTGKCKPRSLMENDWTNVVFIWWFFFFLHTREQFGKGIPVLCLALTFLYKVCLTNVLQVNILTLVRVLY